MLWNAADAVLRMACVRAAAEAVSMIIRAGVAEVDRVAPASDAANDDASSPVALARGAFLRAILQGDRRAALGIARETLRILKPADLYVEVFQPALEDVGVRWQDCRITVAEEHMATATVQFVVAQLYSDAERPGATRGRAVVTGVHGEFHQVGATLVADALERDGWNVLFLGTNMPHEGILKVIAGEKPALVGISATMLYHLDAVTRLVEAIRADKSIAPAPRLIVGGGAFRSSPNLWREIGADGWARDARDACVVAAG
jgi:methanogenic corrinoid protein MtbC1